MFSSYMDLDVLCTYIYKKSEENMQDSAMADPGEAF